MTMLYLTFFFNPNSYLNRLKQIDDSMPYDWRGIVICLSPFNNRPIFRKLKVLYLNNTIRFLNKTPFIQCLLLVLVMRLAKRNKLVIQDWFSVFILSALFLGKTIDVIYSPVTSASLWFKGRQSGQIPFAGIRADLRRVKELLFELPMIVFSKWIIVQSITLRQEYLCLFGFLRENRILVSYNLLVPYSSNFAKPAVGHAKFGSKGKVIRLGYIGNIERQKGSLDLIKLRERLDLDNFILILVGDANGFQNNKILKRLKGMDGVQFKGRISHDKVAEVYSEIDCLILPSYHEGSPRVVSEFYYTGKEIVSYSHPGLDYCVGIEGISLIPIGDIDLFVKTLMNLAGKNFVRTPNNVVNANTLRRAFSEVSIS